MIRTFKFCWVKELDKIFGTPYNIMQSKGYNTVDNTPLTKPIQKHQH